MKRRVIKIGGSLLDIDGIGERFGRWLASQEEAQNFIIVGGGDVVEAMRKLDRVHAFSDSEVHWWCVSLLTTTAKVASRLLPASLIESRGELGRRLAAPPAPETLIVDVSTFYHAGAAQPILEPARGQDERVGLERVGLERVGLERVGLERMPENWATTTDSIAAYFAAKAGISELMLLKSTSTEQLSVQDWAREGLVDDHFPEVANHLDTIHLVDFRTATSTG